MPMTRLAVLSAVYTAQLSANGTSSNNNNPPGVGSANGRELQQGYNMSSGAGRAGRFESDLHGNVNILLGGAMLGGVILVVFFVCYCCHRNMRKNRPHEYSQYWRTEPDVHSLEVFTMDSHAMCYDRNTIAIGQQQPEEISVATLSASIPRPVTPGPPPAYESLIFKPCLASPSDKKPDYGVSLSPVGCILPVPIDLESGHRALKEEESRRDDEGLPSYEAALKLEAHGYV